jgi:uncharacterized protein YutE (UPF0331/DUF86 family)
LVLRPEAVRERLLRLEEVLSNLEALRAEGLDPRAGFRQAWLAERGLQLAAEIALDVGNHILSAHFGVAARDYEDVLTQLAERGVVDKELRERFRGLGGFRNLLVHGYLKLDADRVAEILADAPQRFSSFSRAIREWLARQKLLS